MSESRPTDQQRVAIVTGAARGIGAATAQRLAQDGFAVAVVDLDESATAATVQAIEAAGGRALGIGADVGDADQVQAAVERVVAELGPPVVLVNNAGVTRDNLLFKMTDVDWDLVMHVHLRGSFLMTRATAERIGRDWQEYVAERAAAIPVQRAGTPADIAHTVSFFVSEGAGFVSGQVVYVAGGPRT